MLLQNSRRRRTGGLDYSGIIAPSPEPFFDEIVRAAAAIAPAAGAGVCFSHGAGPLTQVTTGEVDWVLPTIIKALFDPSPDPLTRLLPVHGAQPPRFCAGAFLILDGRVAGITWVNDPQPRALNPSVAALLQHHAALLSEWLKACAQQAALASQRDAARESARLAERSRSSFLANMSHEIRTPLNGVIAMAQVVAMGELSPAQRDRVEVIQRSGESLLQLLNSVLDHTKIAAGQMELDITATDMAALARDTFASFAAVAKRKGLTYRLEISPEAKGIRQGDPNRFAQILANLISNALKFTDAGHVRVSVDGVGDRGEWGLLLKISDTGVGISAEDQLRLFKQFSQVDSSATRRFGGTGLGLSISKGLTDLMGGALSVVSAPGQGSSFSLKLPLALQSPAGQA